MRLAAVLLGLACLPSSASAGHGGDTYDGYGSTYAKYTDYYSYYYYGGWSDYPIYGSWDYDYPGGRYTDLDEPGGRYSSDGFDTGSGPDGIPGDGAGGPAVDAAFGDDTGDYGFGRAEGGCATPGIAGGWLILGLVGLLSSWSRGRHTAGGLPG